MKYRIDRNYTANANRFTFGLITLLMLGFGTVAQSEQLVSGTQLSEGLSKAQSEVLSEAQSSKLLHIESTLVRSTICQNLIPSICLTLEQVQAQAKQPLFLIQ